MTGEPLPSLTFAALEARIEAVPDGPVSILDMPRWTITPYAIGAVAAVFGILPSSLVHVWEPRPWMVLMARCGLGVMCCAFALPFLRAVWTLATQMLNFRKSTIEQMDHDRSAFGEIAHWLAQHPESVVADHLRFAQQMQATLQAKLGFLAGGMDKLGILPAAVAAVLALQNWSGTRQIPLWLAMAGLFLLLLWLVGVLAAAMRLRVRVYESLLGEAMRLRESQETGGKLESK